MTEEIIEVRFIHPTISGDDLTADISNLCTGQEVLQELMRDADGSGAFLAPLRADQTYALSVRRTEREIAPDMTFAEAGVMNGDDIVVGESMVGANIHYTV
jgi:hypothetical protein